MIELLNIDCMIKMVEYSDKYFDLALVDPPYGIGVNKMTLGNGKHKINRGINNWDSKIPTFEYWKELIRISKNRIVWGGNYMTEFLIPSRGWIVWDKGTGDNDYADGELAWTSFDRTLKIFKYSWVGANANNGTARIHPTEKPVQLYKWLLRNYAKPTDKIIDTHGGSMSSVIACYDFGITEMVCCEVDKEYYKDAVKRIGIHKLQQTLTF